MVATMMVRRQLILLCFFLNFKTNKARNVNKVSGARIWGSLTKIGASEAKVGAFGAKIGGSVTKIEASGVKIGASKARIVGFGANIRASGPSGAKISGSEVKIEG